MDFPIRKNYKLVIKLKKKFLFWNIDKNLIIEYKQASMYECIEFIEHSKTNIQDYYLDFIQKHSNIKKSDLIYVLYNLEKIWLKIQETYFFGYFDNKKVTEKIETSIMPFRAYITLISERLSIEPIKLLNYTLEQLKWISDGLVYNSQSEEDRQKGTRKNERQQQFNNLTEIEKKKIKDFLQSND